MKPSAPVRPRAGRGRIAFAGLLLRRGVLLVCGSGLVLLAAGWMGMAGSPA